MKSQSIRPVKDTAVSQPTTINNKSAQQNNKPAFFMRWILALLMFVTAGANAQNVTVTNPGNTTPALSGTYATLALAIADLNTRTAISGQVILTQNANETAPTGGYTIGTFPTGISASNNIILNGAGFTLTAAASPTVGSRSDAVIRIIGSDFITIQNFTIRENPANTVGGAIGVQQMTEFGVGIFATSNTNGAQNNTIQNNTITMSSATLYQNAIGIFSTSASSSTNGAQAASSIAGTNSNNKYYNNIITGVQYGLYFVSPTQTATIFESGNDIGGASAGTGNNITFGVSNTASDLGYTSFSSGTTAGIYFRNVVGNSVRFNTISNVATLTLAPGGVFSANGTAASGVTYTSTCSDNNITLTYTGTAIVNGIDFGSGLTTGTIIGSNNTILLNLNPTGAISTGVRGIRADYTSATSTCSGNNITINTTQTTGANTSNTFGIDQAAAGTTITANSNTITFNQIVSGTGSITGAPIVALNPAGAATTINVLTNTILVNQTTSVASGIGNAITGIRATAAASTALNITTTNQITIKQAVTGAGTYGSGAITYVDLGSVAHGAVNVNGNTFNTTGSTIRSTGALNCVSLGSTTLTGLLTIKSNTANIDRVATSGAVGFFTQTSTSPNDPADTLSNNTITLTSLAGTSTATIINRLGGSSTASRRIENNIISVSGNTTGQIIGISYSFCTLTNANGNTVTISGASPNITGITATSSATSTNANGNTISLSSSNTSPTSMTAIAIAAATSAQNVNNNIISALNFSAVGSTAPIVLGISSTGTGSGAVSISNNAISGISIGAAGSVGSPVISAISAAGGTLTISKNTICSVSTLFNGGSTLISGLRITGSAGTSTISNNRIADLNASAAVSAECIRGINITSSSTTTTLNVYYNTVNISSAAAAGTFGTTGLFHTVSTTATTATLDLRNNIIVNTSGSAGAGLNVAYRRSAGSATNLANYASTSNRNLFYAGTPGASNLIYSDGTSSAQTITAYKNGVFTAGTIAPRDANSVTENPPFLSTTCGNANFLKINTATPTGTESGGATVAGVTDDFEGDARGGTPDIGADEFAGTPLPNCTGTPTSATINGAAAVCTGTGTTLSLSTVYTDLGITYQWRSATVSGGPYSTTLGTNATQATGNLSVTTYYICEITCSFSGLTFTTAEKTVTVNALPTVGVSPTSATYCTPGGTAVTLTASGAVSYTWLPTSGLTPTTGAVVAASPSTNTTYTVTGTDGNGCVNTATSAITVANAVTISSTTATPSTICSGATATLSVNASIANSAYSVAAIGSPSLLTPGASPTTTLSGTASFPVNTSGTQGDDSYSAAVTIPFTFGYNGSNITQFWVSTNGYITFSDPSAVVASNQRTPQTLPSTATPNNTVAIFWHDMDMRTAGNVRYYTIGSAPNRQMVIEFNVIPTFNTTNLHSGQIVLYEALGTIDVVVSASPSTTKTLGIENSGGTAGVAGTGRNNVSWAVAAIEGWRFTLPAPSYAWAPSGDVVSPTSQSTLTNALSSTETFTVTATSGGCSATGTATVTISAGAAIITDPSPTAKCVGETATFTVVASGPGLTYQWRKGGADIAIGGNASAGTATLTLPNVSAGDAATYDVVVSSTCGSPVTSAGALLTVNPLPATVIGAGGGTFCTSTIITASNGGDGTIYYQGTTSGGVSTATPSTSQSVSASGTYYFRAQSAAGCWGAEGSVTVTIQTPAGITGTDASICTGTSGAIGAVASSCTGFVNSGTTISGSWTAGSLTANRITTSTDNSATCGFSTTVRRYTTTQFQVSLTGNYVFTMNDNTNYDGMGYIVTGAFTPGSCATGTWIRGDDDGEGEVTSDEPVLGSASGGGPMSLTAGVTYTLVSGLFTNVVNTFTWTITPPGGGQIMLQGNGQIEWYTAASGGSAIGTGSPFNPVGVLGSGLADTNTPGTTTYYAACQFSSVCRTPVNFVIKPNHDITATAGAGGTISPNGITPVCHGNNQTYTIAAADACHSIADVVVDGVSQGAVGTYTFTNVTATHTISATFSLNTYTITVTAGANGSITPATGSVNCGSNATYTITPNACYSIADVVVDGVSQGAVGTYTFTNVIANHTISATFVLNTYTITVTAGTGGSITPVTGSHNCGDNVTYTITPDACHTIADVVVDGVSQGAVGTYTFTNVTAVHTISASFNVIPYTITVTAGANGSITPATGSVNCGSNATYTITANACYSIADVIVDGVSQGAIGTYTFTNVTANHTISATFVLNTYTITVTAGANGSITPATGSVNCGGNATYTITANTCYSIADVVVDGVSQGAVGTYTFTNVTTNHTISATFVLNTYTITVTAGANGSITPATGSVNCGDNATYTITANACYSIADVVVDGVSQGAVGTYTFTNVTANHTISATFVLNTYTITVTAGANGSITPATGSVNCGDNATYTITPNACYTIADVVVDGVSQGAVGTYTFTNVTANHTISATFVETNYTITVTAGANGSITPATGTVSCGSNATYTITADACYSIADVVVDGVSQGAVGTYTFTNVTANHTISATFVLNTYTITVTAGANGSITPATGSVNCGDNATYTITPNACYSIADVVVDGVSQGTVGTYTFTNVTANHTISATFVLNTYTITVTAGANGSITPATGSVNCGDNATYTITPNACYSIADVVVDGVSQGAVGTYTFTNVTANHTISATFVLNTYTITVTAGANGSITPATGNVNCGDNATYTITANACYSIADVVVDGVSQGAVGTYTFTNVTANHTISATFVLNTYTITVTAGANGSITPATGSVNCGDNATYTITANACYSVADVVVDGVSQGAVGTYTFTNVTADHTISATFALNTYTITVTAGANGSITPATGSVNCGDNATYTITPDACYAIADVVVDGVSQGAVGTYTFTNVTANHTISATFALTTYTITVTAGANGSITPATGSVNCGANATYTITADPCYHIDNVIVDGVSQGAVGTYTFTNVTANHTISATFGINTYLVSTFHSGNGGVLPNNPVVNCGDNATFTITPAACYHIADVLVDGVSVGIVGTYTFTNVTANHDIFAVFQIDTYNITVTAGANGSITPGSGTVLCGNNYTYTITPDACYTIADVVVDGVSQGAVGTYTFTNVTANHTISATFVQTTYTITVTAGANGSITPATGSVNCGDNATYTITANACYSIADVVVDGVSQGAVGTYTFTNVTANHTISATFVLNIYTITVTAGANGSITPATGSVNCGANATYTITPNACYSIADVVVDGVSQGAVGTYTFTNVTANHTISATFVLNTYTITVTAGANGSITPATGSVNCGANATYTITPNGGFAIADVVVDGVSQGAVGTYTFTNVTANHTISATFVNNASFTITSSAGANGSISPNGATVVNSGASQSYTMSPAACYHVQDVLVDGVSVGAVTSYTFTNVTANHTISVTFALNAQLTVSVSGPVNVCPYVGTGTPVTYTATSAGATGFTWVIPTTNVTIVSGQGTANLTVTFQNGFIAQVNKQLRVTALSPCGNSAQFIYYLAAQTPITPGPIVASSSNICAVIGTAGTITYTINAVPGAATYNWSAQSLTTTINHPNGPGMNDTTVTVSFTNGFSSSNISVSASSTGCGTGGTRSLLITRSNPSTPGLISGPTNACPYMAPGGTTATYSVALVPNATSYTWTVPAGAIGLTGQGTNTISFTYPNTFVSGSITVSATNGCGTSAVRSLTINKLAPATPSIIDVIQTQPCPNREYTYTLSGMPANATSVQWTIPLGASIVSGQGTVSITVSYPPTAFNSAVTAQAFNNCGSSSIRSTTVHIPACPVERLVISKGGSTITTPSVESMLVNVYPNPTVNDFKLQVTTAGKEAINVRILNLQGRQLKNFVVTPYQTTTIGSDLKAGTYMVEVRQGNNVKVTKLIKF